MTRKDYIAIAEVLRELYRNNSLATGAGTLDAPPLLYQGRLDGVWQAAKDIAFVMENDNPRFNREHFLAVVRGERELNSKPPR